MKYVTRYDVHIRKLINKMYLLRNFQRCVIANTFIILFRSWGSVVMKRAYFLSELNNLHSIKSAP